MLRITSAGRTCATSFRLFGNHFDQRFVETQPEIVSVAEVAVAGPFDEAVKKRLKAKG